MAIHDADQVQGAHKVVVVVLQRFLHRFADGFKPGKVDDRIDGTAGENALHGSFVHEVHLMELGGLAAQFGYPP